MRLDQLHMPSNPSSPPTSHSPSSLRSEPLYDSSGRIISPREAGHLALVEGDLHAKSNRAGAGGSVSTKGKGTARAGKATGTAPAYVKKETRVEQGICDNCSKVFATINLRGHQQDFGNEFDLVYYCLDCAPESLGISREALEASIGLPTVHVAEAPRDGMSGTSVSKNIFIEGTTGPPNMVKLVPRGPKKRIRATDVSSPTVCDVCSRWIANGAPVPRDQGAELAFNVEIVCTLCTEKYRRCSDCGGGGGARLG